MNFRRYNRWNFLKFPGVLTIFLISLTACGKDPLFSDKAMIAHFHAHREAFEALVATAKVYDEAWEQRPDIIVLKKKAGVETVVGGNGSPWDDPYARDRDPKQRLKKLDEEKKQKQEWNHRYLRESLVVKMKRMGYYKRNYELAGQLSWKDYVYFPDGRTYNTFFQPSINWEPNRKNPKYSSKYGNNMESYKVVASLDASREDVTYKVRGAHSVPYAFDWQHGAGCAVREITPRWFLRRCWLN